MSEDGSRVVRDLSPMRSEETTDRTFEHVLNPFEQNECGSSESHVFQDEQLFEDWLESPLGIEPQPVNLASYSFLDQLQCDFLGKPFLLSDFYDEATPFRSFEALLTFVTREFSTYNVQQRALQKALMSDIPTLDLDHVRQNSTAFAADPVTFISSLQDSQRHGRLCSERILHSFPEASLFPEWDLLCTLVGGISPPLDPEFSPNPKAAKLRSSMVSIQPALDALVQVSVAKGEVVVVTTDSFLEAVSTHQLPAHTSPAHHIGKPDDSLGRFLFDYSNADDCVAINTPYVKARLPELFGKLELPSIADLYVIFEEVSQVFPNTPLVFSKSDVGRAFHRLVWSPAASSLMAIQLSADHTILPLTLGFGSSLAPYAYGVVSRFFDFMHERRIANLDIQHPTEDRRLTRLGITYVDDGINVGPYALLLKEKGAAATLFRAALGEDAVNTSKDEISSCLTTLGVRSDASTKSSSPSWRAYLKLLYVFFIELPPDVTSHTRLKLKAVQRLAQLALRYSVHIPVLSGSAYNFFAATKGKGPTRRLSQRQIDDVWLWRWVLRRSFTHATLLQSSFRSVIIATKKYRDTALLFAESIVYTDASGRECNGLEVLEVEAMGVYIPQKAWLFFEWPGLPFHISCFELLASVIGFLLALHINPQLSHVHLFIDNCNAIAWSTGKIKTDHYFSRNLVTLNALSQGAYKGCCQSRQYIPSKENRVADAISRRRFDIPELQDIHRYRLAPHVIDCLIELSQCSATRPLEIVLGIPTMWASDNFVSF